MRRRWFSTFRSRKALQPLVMVLGEPVVALGSGVGVAVGDRSFERRPPGFDGGREAVNLGRAGRRGLVVGFGSSW